MSEERKLKKRTAFAREIGVVPETVDLWLREGKYGLKKVKAGHSVFVDVTDFDLTNLPQQIVSKADRGYQI